MTTKTPASVPSAVPSARSLMTCPGCRKRGVNLRLGREDHWACRYCHWFAYSAGADQVDVEGRIALRARNLLHPSAPRTRFWATFIPQAWVRDHAVDVDPHGEQSWVVSDGLVPAAAQVIARVSLAEVVGDGVLDTDDRLAVDPAAPTWVREWSGPFRIHVTGTEHHHSFDDE